MPLAEEQQWQSNSPSLCGASPRALANSGSFHQASVSHAVPVPMPVVILWKAPEIQGILLIMHHSLLGEEKVGKCFPSVVVTHRGEPHGNKACSDLLHPTGEGLHVPNTSWAVPCEGDFLILNSLFATRGGSACLPAPKWLVQPTRFSLILLQWIASSAPCKEWAHYGSGWVWLSPSPGSPPRLQHDPQLWVTSFLTNPDAAPSGRLLICTSAENLLRWSEFGLQWLLLHMWPFWLLLVLPRRASLCNCFPKQGLAALLGRREEKCHGALAVPRNKWQPSAGRAVGLSMDSFLGEATGCSSLPCWL